MAYDKAALFDVGGALVDAILALADGVGSEDIDEVTALVVALSGQAQSIAADPDAAVLDILAGAASAFADVRRDPAAVPV